MKKRILKITTHILVLLFALFLGYLAGAFHYDKSMRVGYKLGLISFCELKEVDRFKVCPILRLHKEMKAGGSLTLYVCSSRVAYLETDSLSNVSTKKVKERLAKARSVGTVEKACSTKSGKIFKIIGTENDQHSF